MADNYGQEYQDALFKKLSPQIEARIRNMFAGRGARFGAADKFLAEALAKLQTEIAIDAETKRAASAEDDRRFTRNQQEQIRREQAVAAREDQRRAIESANAERTRNQNILEYDRRLKSQREYELGKRSGFPKGSEYEQYNLKYPGVYDEEEERRRRQIQDRPAGTEFGGSTIIQNPMRSLRPAPRSYEDVYGEPAPDANKPFEHVGGPGDINENTPGEFEKIGRDIQDTAEGIWDGITDAFDSFWAPGFTAGTEDPETGEPVTSAPSLSNIPQTLRRPMTYEERLKRRAA